MNKFTNFGYEKVTPTEKTSKVKEVFNSVASKYDIMNDLMSFGIHRLWKKVAIRECNITPNDTILDLAGGTGDLAKQIAKIINRTNAKGSIVLSDINNSMLSIGRDKLINNGFTANVSYVQSNAERLPFKSNYFNCITIAFGLRNVTDKLNALKEMQRILKPGGRLVILEFSHPNNPVFKEAYDLYSFNILPILGNIVTNDASSYKYLAESIRMHPKQQELKQMLLDAGFDDCNYKNMTGGICAIHKGFKY